MRGDQLRIGKLLELMLCMASDTAEAYLDRADDVWFTTACIDECNIRREPKVDVDTTMQSYIVHVGSTSCMVRVDVEQSGELVTSSHFVLVARNRITDEPFKMPALDTKSDL